MITQPEEGKYHLEDLTGTVAIDLKTASALANDRIVTECSQVILEGNFDQGKNVFNVINIIMPPLEEREEALRSMGLTGKYILQ